MGCRKPSCCPCHACLPPSLGDAMAEMARPLACATQAADGSCRLGVDDEVEPVGACVAGHMGSVGVLGGRRCSRSDASALGRCTTPGPRAAGELSETPLRSASSCLRWLRSRWPAPHEETTPHVSLSPAATDPTCGVSPVTALASCQGA